MPPAGLFADAVVLTGGALPPRTGYLDEYEFTELVRCGFPYSISKRQAELVYRKGMELKHMLMVRRRVRTVVVGCTWWRVLGGVYFLRRRISAEMGQCRCDGFLRRGSLSLVWECDATYSVVPLPRKWSGPWGGQRRW